MTAATTVAGVVLTVVGGRLWWWADAPIWLLAIPGAATGNVVGQLVLSPYYVDLAMDRLDGERQWWLVAPGVASGLLLVASGLVFDAQERALGGPGGWTVAGILVGIVMILVVVMYWRADWQGRRDTQ
jgi:hypothetical protein